MGSLISILRRQLISIILPGALSLSSGLTKAISFEGKDFNGTIGIAEIDISMDLLSVENISTATADEPSVQTLSDRLLRTTKESFAVVSIGNLLQAPISNLRNMTLVSQGLVIADERLVSRLERPRKNSNLESSSDGVFCYHRTRGVAILSVSEFDEFHSRYPCTHAVQTGPILLKRGWATDFSRIPGGDRRAERMTLRTCGSTVKLLYTASSTLKALAGAIESRTCAPEAIVLAEGDAVGYFVRDVRAREQIRRGGAIGNPTSTFIVARSRQLTR